MSKFFPDPRRIVTGHSSAGKAVMISDSTLSCDPLPIGPSSVRIWDSTEFPATNQGTGVLEPEENPLALAIPNGIVMRCVDFPPHSPPFMHRTLSLDFGVVMEGEVTCEFDDGVTVDMKPGNICVQRGTIHGWINKTDKPARMYFVLIAAKPVTVDGKELAESMGGS